MSNRHPIFTNCSPQCTHTIEEHEAFDIGLTMGREYPDKPNPYRDSDPALSYAWQAGYSVGWPESKEYEAEKTAILGTASDESEKLFLDGLFSDIEKKAEKGKTDPNFKIHATHPAP